MSVEFLPEWIYTFLLLPIIVLFQRYFALSSRVAVIENTQNLKKEDIKELQRCMKDFSLKVENLGGKIDGFLLNSS